MTKWDVYEIIEGVFKWIEHSDIEGISEFYYDYDKDTYPEEENSNNIYNENRKKFFEILKNAIDKYEEK